MIEKSKDDDSLLIKVNPQDNVKIVVDAAGLKAGTEIADGIIAKECIPQGHKILLEDLKKGEAVVKYARVIGYASEDIARGSWINENNIIMPEAPPLENLPIGTEIKELPALEGHTFSGYVNSDGSVGTKNMLGIVCCVQCVEGILNIALDKIKRKLLPQYPYVDGIVPINHNYGCGVAIDAPDALIPIRTIKNLALNPNIGENIVISLGCEKLPPDKLLAGTDLDAEVIVLQEELGFEKMIETIIEKSRESLERLNTRRRDNCSASKLTVGLQCGGSDAFSGLTANPAVGYAADLLVRAGAAVLFSEVSEVRDGLHLLSPRVINEEVGKKLKENIAWYDRYLNLGDVDRAANTTPGNKKGGLVNIVEKSLGSIEKSGSSPIVDVLAPGERVSKRGLIFAATPASDFVCGTLQLAAGITTQVFTTGRGTPYGLAMAPVIKISSRTGLKNSWDNLIDIDAGKIITAQATYQEIGEEIFKLILEVASGRKRTRADYWGIENRMCLFNPAPIT